MVNETNRVKQFVDTMIDRNFFTYASVARSLAMTPQLFHHKLKDGSLCASDLFAIAKACDGRLYVFLSDGNQACNLDDFEKAFSRKSIKACDLFWITEHLGWKLVFRKILEKAGVK